MGVVAESFDGPKSLAEDFLLTDLPETERQRLEEQILLDDDFFEQVLAAEDDLLDAAARGELDPQTADRLAQLPDLEQRLAFASELAQASAQHANSVSSPAPLRRLAPWLAAAAALWLAVGLGWLWFTLQKSAAEFVLQPTGIRGGGPELTVPEGTEKVKLHLELKQGFPDNRFAVFLENAEGQELERWETLHSERFSWGSAVVVQIPGEFLLPGSYAARLLYIDAQGAGTEAGIYAFTVVLPEP